MENREVLKEEDAKKIWTKIQDLHELSVIEELLKDNKIEFTIDEVRYRIRPLTLQDKELLHDKRRKKFCQLLQDKDILLEQDLIRLYKERGTDIEDFDKSIRLLEADKKSIVTRLGEAIAHKANIETLESFKKEIEEVDGKIKTLVIQKNDLLLFSLETQLSEYITEVMIWLSLEKKDEELFVKAFETFEDFKNNIKEDLKVKAAYYSLALHYR